jgi:hypothetical protein
MASASKLYTVMGLVATLGATVAARKAMTATWKLSTGKQPPTNPEHPDVSLGEAVAWAVASGVAVGLGGPGLCRAASVLDCDLRSAVRRSPCRSGSSRPRAGCGGARGSSSCR